VRSNIVTNFKIYWAGKNEGYAENRSAFVRINYVQEKIRIFLDRFGTHKEDPDRSCRQAGEKLPKIFIKSLVISQAGYTPIRFATPD